VEVMKKHYLLLAVFVLAAATLLLWNCSQQQDSGRDSVVNAKGDGTEETDEECSITVPDPEPEDLSTLALITAEQAQDAVLAAYPGATVTEVDLDNENGCLVYSVELNDDTDVKVDAGNGVILGIESDDDQGNHEDEGDVDDDQDNDDDEDDDNEDDDDGPGGGK
jgi:uncharacterized membrane protein YkoI